MENVPLIPDAIVQCPEVPISEKQFQILQCSGVFSLSFLTLLATILSGKLGCFATCFSEYFLKLYKSLS